MVNSWMRSRQYLDEMRSNFRTGLTAVASARIAALGRKDKRTQTAQGILPPMAHRQVRYSQLWPIALKALKFIFHFSEIYVSLPTS
jgi:hypothetical protein